MYRRMFGFVAAVLLVVANGLAEAAETCASAGSSVRWQRTETGIRIVRGNVTRTLDFYGPGALRIKSDLGADYWRHPSLAIVAKPVNKGFDVSETAGTVELACAEFIARVSKATGAVTFVGKGGEVLQKIDRVGKDLKLADGVCGSISGSVPTCVGQPMIRVSSLTVGGR